MNKYKPGDYLKSNKTEDVIIYKDTDEEGHLIYYVAADSARVLLPNPSVISYYGLVSDCRQATLEECFKMMTDLLRNELVFDSFTKEVISFDEYCKRNLDRNKELNRLANAYYDRLDEPTKTESSASSLDMICT